MSVAEDGDGETIKADYPVVNWGNDYGTAAVFKYVADLPKCRACLKWLLYVVMFSENVIWTLDESKEAVQNILVIHSLTHPLIHSITK